MYNKDKYCRHDRHLFSLTSTQVQVYPESLKNQWTLSEERARLRFIAQQAIPISSERRILRQWLQSGRETHPTTLAIRTIPLHAQTEQVIHDSNKRYYTTAIYNASPAIGSEIFNQQGKRTRLLPKGLLVASNLRYTLRKRKDNPIPPPKCVNCKVMYNCIIKKKYIYIK